MTTTNSTVSTITPRELHNLWQSGQAIDLIDVRTPAEYREFHVEFARSVPFHRLNPQAIQTERGLRTQQPLYFICQSGKRAGQACEKFAAAGFTNVVNVEGGTVACEAAGLPLARGQKTMSLERQVRIAAGALVLLGAGLSFVHPLWALLAAFVGAGLMFAGITDTCGMAMVLARMPWNQGKTESPKATPPAGVACKVR